MGNGSYSSLVNPLYDYIQACTHQGSTRARRQSLRGASFIAVALLAIAYLYLPTIGPSYSRDADIQRFISGLHSCQKLERVTHHQANVSRQNPRWSPTTGQQKAFVLQNATLFDGENFVKGGVDIVFEKGVIKSISPTSSSSSSSDAREVWNVRGKYVTPGLVDLHSHHLVWPFHALLATRDVNETPLLGPLTPFVRAIDGFKPYDPAIEAIASGGVTTSLIIPGSANIIGGEGYIVKNVAFKDTEPVIEHLLLDHGLPAEERQRYLKMACGENPKHTYFHTRLGNTWLLREHFSKAQKIKEEQDAWCDAASDVRGWPFGFDAQASKLVRDLGEFPQPLEYEFTIATLRGQSNVNIHCYEPEDLERMLAVVHEFGVHPRAFHHALEAWQVPELLKQQERNITIATFAENAFFKAEAYGASLRAGKILADHGVAVAFKSDHTGEGNNAKYLLHQAAVAHSFGLPSVKALQSVTSIPARSLQQDHRVGFVKPGYDADVVVWDSHPLSIGATALQVFVDGKRILDSRKVDDSVSLASHNQERSVEPKTRPFMSEGDRRALCSKLSAKRGSVVFTGIRKSFLPDRLVSSEFSGENLTLVLEKGNITCLDTNQACLSLIDDRSTVVTLRDGHITPGLIAVSRTLGLSEISQEPITQDGIVDPKADALNENDIDYAKYGLHLGGRAFARARLGGITKGVVAPILRGGFLNGISVGFRTNSRKTVLDGGIFKEEVALHFTLGQTSKAGASSTISGSVGKLRRILSINSTETNWIYPRAANGELPIVVHAVNTDTIRQLIWVKKDFPSANIVIFGGHGAPLVANELAAAKIPVILTGNRGVPDTWEKRDALVGPPLTRSPARILAETGVLFALAIEGDSHIHNLLSEAGWAAKYAGLNESQAVELVSDNVKTILGLHTSGAEISRHGQDSFVVWDGNPLIGEGSVVASFEDDGELAGCWPDDD